MSISIDPNTGKPAVDPNTGNYVITHDSSSPFSGFHSLRDNPISNAIFGKPAGPQPGVGGPAKDPSKLVKDPNTGLFYDPTTGTSYTDAAGQVVVTNPNVAQQVAKNVSNSQAFLNQLGGLNNERQQVFGAQTDLGDTFRKVISGQAPSVAQTQAQINANDAARMQLAAAAGASGASAPLAGLMAARNTGQAQIAANNAGILGHTQEESDAAKNLNALLNSQGTGVQNAIDTTTGAGINFAKLGETGQEAQQGLNYDAAKQKAKDEQNFGYSLVKGIGDYFGT